MDDRQIKKLRDKLLAAFLQPVERAREAGKEAFDLFPHWPEGFDIGNGTSYAGFEALRLSLEQDKTVEDVESVVEYHRWRIDALRQELTLNRYSEHTRLAARRLAESANLPVTIPPKSWFLPEGYEVEYEAAGVKSTWTDRYPEFTSVCRVVVQTLIEGHEVELERVKGIYGSDRQRRANDRLASAAKSFTLNDLWTSYRNQKTAGGEWADTTEEHYQGFVEAVNRICGEDHDFSIYEDVDNVPNLIRQLKEYKSSRTGKRWSASRVNDCIVFLSTLHRNAMRNRKFGILFNPFEARQIADTDSKKREALTPEELTAVWQGLQKMKGKANKADLHWVMLLMLYTGARIGEVCQLRLDDFEKIGEHWVVHYRSRPDLGQTIKGERRKKKKRPNVEVDRITAIHPHLRSLGLLKRAEQLKEAGELKFFPNEKRIGARAGVLMAKKVKTFFKQCLGRETEKSAHYCRHTLITWFKQNLNLTHTDASLISAMIGHEDEVINGGNKITWGTYGGAHTAKQMYNLIRRVDYGFVARLP